MAFEHTRYMKFLGELIVILITIQWLQKLGKDCQQVNKQHRNLMGKDLILLS
jgi:hypothetical protein